jgi:hypothetical protein
MAHAQVQPPTDIDLKASYCLRLTQLNLTAMNDYVPGKSQKVDNLVRDAQDRSDRLRSYLLPRLTYLDPKGLLAAAKRAEVDSTKYSQLVERCSAGDCTPTETPAACSNRIIGCMNGDLQDRVGSCAKLTWLPF